MAELLQNGGWAREQEDPMTDQGVSKSKNRPIPVRHRPSVGRDSAGADRPSGHGGVRWVWVGLAVVAVAAAVPLAMRHGLRGEILDALSWTGGLGPWAPWVFTGLSILAMVFLFSTTVMALAAGYLFGLVGGCLTTLIGFGLGALAAFALGRTCFRGLVERRLAGHPQLAAIDRAINEKGLRVVLLTRLATPYPSLFSYLFSLTSVRLGPYALGTWLGVIPRTLLYVYLGTLLKRSADILAEGEGLPGGPLGYVYGTACLIVAVVLLLFLRNLARKALRQAVDSSTAAGGRDK